jgi:hypothetical protein
MSIKEGQEQRGDVVAVRVCIREQHHLRVAQLRDVERLADPAAEGGDEVSELTIIQHLPERQGLGVQHLAAERQDGLQVPVTPLFGGAAGGVTLDEK